MNCLPCKLLLFVERCGVVKGRADPMTSQWIRIRIDCLQVYLFLSVERYGVDKDMADPMTSQFIRVSSYFVLKGAERPRYGRPYYFSVY